MTAQAILIYLSSSYESLLLSIQWGSLRRIYRTSPFKARIIRAIMIRIIMKRTIALPIALSLFSRVFSVSYISELSLRNANDSFNPKFRIVWLSSLSEVAFLSDRFSSFLDEFWFFSSSYFEFLSYWSYSWFFVLFYMLNSLSFIPWHPKTMSGFDMFFLLIL